MSAKRTPGDTWGSARGTRFDALDYDPAAAVRRLRRADPDLRRVIAAVGPFAMKTREKMTPFEALLRSIVYQQISGKAARSIHDRMLALFPRRHPSPARLAALDDGELRAAGFSRGKIRAARDLAEKCRTRVVPGRAALARMDDEAVIECLSQVHGVGRWTAEILLIFHLGRGDVLPVSDLGIRRGFQIARGDDALPEPKALEAHAERWRPYRSVASWYLWQANYL